ncbi:hypothetical protein [Mobiluncus mulieris]|uniref:Uncharacterized protein n=2 Tax=Mobiluncus mulieris TaxID=2052 RepID=E0QQY8_9ACTO|nr:hypothetical protein [Mobiluncus mulieris]EEZ90226.1 hypothetical protein HMPREF0578_0131 [Mobiluncus mulieris 28-1]EFM45981.1 hypothetical protein HMPREF0580_1303 [Mobiluncus mulieris ATCC 35239]EFN93112.1 hypothetical protein HMPREF9278_1387 [Mobiluncus mulieris FB024-16]MCU9970925.1 hypothetical protein [Mobiluncus mulieris]MCU9975322.1 hypothetical protein [Mobiluncus mulieris]
MQLIIIALWWILALFLAIYLVIRARPHPGTERFQAQVYVKEVEALTEDDVHRSHPYEVTVLIHAWESNDEAEFHEVSLNPTDLNPGRAREALRHRQPLTAWVSSFDPRDIVFTRDESWNMNRILWALLVLAAQFIATGASLFNLKTIEDADPWFVFMFPLVIGALVYLGGIALTKSVRNFILWVRLSSNPVTVPARITGVRQILGRGQGRQNGYEVSIMWAPLGMPVQYSKVQVDAARRRTTILLQRLIREQLKEEAAGNFRVQSTKPEDTAHSAIAQFDTPGGETTIKITALPSSDPRSDPRPPKVREAAAKARAKREAQLLAEREAFEEATAKARIEAAERAELGSEDHNLETVAAEGPRAWYYPINLSRVNLMGFDTGAERIIRLARGAFLWLGLGIVCVSLAIYLGFLQPDLMFPVYQNPNPGYEPLGKWE